MKSSSKVLIGLAAAAAVLGVVLLLRRRAAAAPLTAPALPEATPQAAYAGFVAANSGAGTGGGSSLSSQAVGAYSKITGAGTAALCTAYTKGQGGALCDLAGSLQSKFASVTGTAITSVGGKLVSGAKSVFNKINPF